MDDVEPYAYQPTLRQKLILPPEQTDAINLLSAEMDVLMDVFPSATGRDIKGLTKLVAKFCNPKQVAPSLEVFRRCSIFRGLEAAG